MQCRIETLAIEAKARLRRINWTIQAIAARKGYRHEWGDMMARSLCLLDSRSVREEELVRIRGALK
jgi:hypothetical protein